MKYLLCLFLLSGCIQVKKEPTHNFNIQLQKKEKEKEETDRFLSRESIEIFWGNKK